ncbi:MAG: GxxExxY protein [Candidatus Omnitrophica bacterium]|nr:GxxExxY protein [Candidatus Omnitrophota bacterium]
MKYATKITQIRTEDPLTKQIIACCFKVHNALGPGFNEKIYHKALELALEDAKISYETGKKFSVFFEDR